jgi:hypothetical protein
VNDEKMMEDDLFPVGLTKRSELAELGIEGEMIEANKNKDLKLIFG